MVELSWMVEEGMNVYEIMLLLFLFLSLSL